MDTLLAVLAVPAGTALAMFVLGVAAAASAVRESDLFALFKAR
jgi:hypothetical protein